MPSRERKLTVPGGLQARLGSWTTMRRYFEKVDKTLFLTSQPQFLTRGCFPDGNMSGAQSSLISASLRVAGPEPCALHALNRLWLLYPSQPHLLAGPALHLEETPFTTRPGLHAAPPESTCSPIRFPRMHTRPGHLHLGRTSQTLATQGPGLMLGPGL